MSNIDFKKMKKEFDYEKEKNKKMGKYTKICIFF